MKKDKKVLLIAPLLILWACVLYSQFFANEAEATSEVSAVAHPTGPTTTHTPTVTQVDTEDQEEHLVATPEILEQQNLAARQRIGRNPFTEVELGTPKGQASLSLTAIIGTFAIINGERYSVGDSIPGYGTLKSIGRGFVEIETRSGVQKLTRQKKSSRRRRGD